MNDLKVIVMDVDGTLTNSKKVITEKTKETLMKAQELGYTLILASGRPTTGLVGFAKELEMDKHNGLLVSYNGSQVVDFTKNEILFNEPLTVVEAKSILRHIKQFDITPMIDDGKHIYVENLDGLNVEYEASGGNFILEQVEDLEEFITFETNKILTSGSPEYLQTIFNQMKDPFNNELSCVFTAPFYVEYTAKGIDKAKALETILKPMGYTRDQIIAFGDGHNDITMLKYAGVAVAMDNAVQDLKDVADFITLSNEEDGIAHALEKYIVQLNVDKKVSALV
ncbi:HAD family phosphatase [Alkalicella caledoniensis]|uniref:HAD family phosphatase n=1 Tax=Alkalicella caledoniensis TaxID=2731377 RepID=A0A7G9W5V3_ALKCA|nr:Cof-type HAD-IIB family hydrolase [Alkalicella caledoniensis]QNO14065.1 HAD family phosphatase [Alkalicella caledoniensis]